MSVSYWMCQGVGIRTNELLPFLSTQKCVQFMKTQLPDDDITEDKFNIDDYLYGTLLIILRRCSLFAMTRTH